MSDEKLPPRPPARALPAPTGIAYGYDYNDMNAYARRAILADRERAQEVRDAVRAQGVRYKPETWPEDADGDPPNLCNVCGTPVAYGERHHGCGSAVMKAEALERPYPYGRPVTAEEAIDRIECLVAEHGDEGCEKALTAIAALREVMGLPPEAEFCGWKDLSRSRRRPRKEQP